MRNYYARVPASLYSEATGFHIAGEARRELGAGYENISSKLNERGWLLVPSFGSADSSEISKRNSLVANIQFLWGGYGRKCDKANELITGPVQFSKSIVWLA